MRRWRVHADLRVRLDDGALVTVTADGDDTLTVTFPDLASGLRLWRRHAAVLRPLMQQGKRLKSAGLQLRIAAGDTVIAHMERGASAGWLARLLGLAPLRLRPLVIARDWLSC